MKKIDYIHNLSSGELSSLIKKYICDKVACKLCPLWEYCKDKMGTTWEDDLEGEMHDG